MVIQYKCPNCGADMSFDAASGKLSCASCGHNDNIENVQKANKSADYNEAEAAENVDEVLGDYEPFEEKINNNSYTEEEAVEYKCNNCGAVLVTDVDTTATSCGFCGAAMVLGDRLTGKKAPVCVIPFTITKEQAIDSFKKWCKKGLLTPKGFMSADRVKNITGIYVPFWLYDLSGRGEAHATCTKVRAYSAGDYNYTETKYYEVYRKVDLNYSDIPVDASEKMNDNMMDKLEPFHYSDKKDFSAPYLAGYVAENYNFTDKDLFPRVENRTKKYISSFIKSTISGYSSVSMHHEDLKVLQKKADYTLLPVWMICYDYKDAEHNFAMNGQTGKIVGKPPLSKAKVGQWFAGISVASFVILKLIGLLLGGF